MLDGSNLSSDDKLYTCIHIDLKVQLSNWQTVSIRQLTFIRAKKRIEPCRYDSVSTQIITDLLTYTEEIMTPAMHSELFISALTNVAIVLDC